MGRPHAVRIHRSSYKLLTGMHIGEEEIVVLCCFGVTVTGWGQSAPVTPRTAFVQPAVTRRVGMFPAKWWNALTQLTFLKLVTDIYIRLEGALQTGGAVFIGRHSRNSKITYYRLQKRTYILLHIRSRNVNDRTIFDLFYVLDLFYYSRAHCNPPHCSSCFMHESL